MTALRALAWRLAYRLLRSRAAISIAAAVLRLADRTRGEGVGDFLLSRFEVRYVWAGAFVNLDASRFAWRVRMRRAGRPAAVKRAPRQPAQPLRLGCVGRFAGLLSFGPELFAAAPPDLRLHVFDVEYEGATASYVEPLVAHYDASPLELSDAINAADLEALLLVLRGAEAYDLAGRVSVPCVIFVCTGSDLLHHPAVDIQLYAQPQADYFLRGRRLFCARSRTWFDDSRLQPAFLAYDARGLDPAARPSWAERESIVVVHGSLYKLAGAKYLDCLARLLHDDPGLELVVMGKDDGRSLEEIRKRVGPRLRYEGAFSPVRGPDGSVVDPGWEKLRGLLFRARLAPDPFPICGATSRVEAFGAGVPSPHLAVRFGEEGRRQDALVEVPALRVPPLDAHTVAEYESLCRRCLYEPAFADEAAAAQAAVFAEVTDGSAYWRQILAAYREWAERTAPSTR